MRSQKASEMKYYRLKFISEIKNLIDFDMDNLLT